MLIMHHKHDKSKVTAIWFLLSSSCSGVVFFSSLDEFDEYKIKSLTYSAIAAIPNDELKGIKKVKLALIYQIEYSNQISV